MDAIASLPDISDLTPEQGKVIFDLFRAFQLEVQEANWQHTREMAERTRDYIVSLNERLVQYRAENAAQERVRIRKG